MDKCEHSSAWNTLALGGFYSLSKKEVIFLKSGTAEFALSAAVDGNVEGSSAAGGLYPN